MKPRALIAVSVVALAAAACHPKPAKLTRLDCPATQGALTRVSVAPDGRSCTYTSEQGAEIDLRIVEVQGGLNATLDRLEAELRAEAAAAAPAAAEAAAAGDETAPVAPAADDASAEAAARAAAEAQSDAAPRGGRVVARVEKANGETTGDRVSVSLPGIQIEADEGRNTAKVSVFGREIHASDGDVRMRHVRDVRLRGEALSREKRGVRARLVLAGEAIDPAYSYLEYEAGGPRSGPLAAALVKARTGDPMGHDHSDVTRLVRRNGGV